MPSLKDMSPIRAIQDLRVFLSQRSRYELVFFAAAVMTTTVIVAAFVKDYGQVEVPYKREIIYVENWRADRSEAEILKQQRFDMYKKAQTDAELALRERHRREQFKKVDDKLKAWGL